jgi:hypothetical protein
MSKKARFRRGSGSKYLATRLVQASLPKTVIVIKEGDRAQTFKSQNSRQSTISKLAKNSAVPSWVFYELKKAGSVSFNGIDFACFPWTAEWDEKFKSENKD